MKIQPKKDCLGKDGHSYTWIKAKRISTKRALNKNGPRKLKGAPFWSGNGFREWIPPLERWWKVMKNEYKIDPISMHEDRGMIKQNFGKSRGLLEWGLPAVSKLAVLDILCEGSFGDIFGTTFWLFLQPQSSGFPSLFSLYLFLFIFLVFSLIFAWFLTWESFQPNFLASRLLVSVRLNHEKCPARPRHQSLWYGISNPWIRPKLARLKLFYLLQIHCLNSIFKVGVFWTFYYLKIIVRIFSFDYFYF